MTHLDFVLLLFREPRRSDRSFMSSEAWLAHSCATPSEAFEFGSDAGEPESSLHAGTIYMFCPRVGDPAFSFSKLGKGGRFGVGLPASFLAQ